MALIMASSKQQLLDILQERLRSLVEPGDEDNIALFTQHFFGIVPLEELLERHDSDLLGCTLSFWRFMQHRQGAQEKLRVFNPDTQQHGWETTHSVIEMLHPDSPFLVDSIRLELKRQNLTIHTLQNSVMKVERDEQGTLLRLHDPATPVDESIRAESVIYVEIERCASPGGLKTIQAGLSDALEQVRAAVGDFPAMQERMREVISGLADGQGGYFAEDERAEAMDFLQWLLADHFTFLGYERFSIRDGLKEHRLGIEQQHSLGVSTLDEWDDSINDLPESVIQYLQQPLLLSFAKASRFSRVHRPAYPDYVSVREVDAQGNVLLEHRFMGLYTSRVYRDGVDRIPYLRRKVALVREEIGLNPDSHLGKELDQVLQLLPRDDLFQMSPDVLRDTAIGIVQIQERARIRVFLRRGNYGRFYYCLVFVPRDMYSTAIRMKIQAVLMDRLQASDCEFWTYFSESILTRTQFILRVDPSQHEIALDQREIEHDVIQACRNWHDDFRERLGDSLGEADAAVAWANFGEHFPAGYSERFTTASAVVDLRHLLSLTDDEPLAMSFYQPLTQKQGVLHCKLYHLGEPLPL